MKFKTTKKEITGHFPHIVCLGYCVAENLLEGVQPIAYTSGTYGWNADIYDMGDGVAIVTGYRPFGNIKPDGVLGFERAARDVWNGPGTYEERREKVEHLRRLFIAALIPND